MSDLLTERLATLGDCRIAWIELDGIIQRSDVSKVLL